MPVKMRRSKRRVDPVTEARAWTTAFHCKWDFFGDLNEYGLNDQAAVSAAMPDAWRRLGRIFLDRGMESDFNGTPFALREFGEPPCP